MSYTVFALKWRPQTFDEVVGQEHITITLKNAVKLNRVAHAYLFSGPRGVGKTSVARILAKTLNCSSKDETKPCNKCTNCLEISKGVNLDVLEIDGASNRRIDDIREIGENVRFAPSNSTYKIYIIDEVHMLTKEAFNALLKTLEEPPAHVKFIFATTEPEKIIDTIISRCQKFDFRRIDVNTIVTSLKTLLNNEGHTIGDNILFDIARAADGGMRDAQSLLDQIISYSDDNINKEDVEMILGLVGFEKIGMLADNIFKGEAYLSLNFIDSIIKQGKDVYIILTNLIRYLRELVLLKISAGKENLAGVSLTQNETAFALEIIKSVSVEKIMYILSALIELEPKIKKHNMPRVPFETTIIKLTHLSDLKSLSSLVDIIKSGKVPAVINTNAQSLHVSSPSPAAQQQTVTPTVKQVNTKVKTLENPNIDNLWTSLINELKVKKLPLSMTLSKGMATKFDGKKLIISFSAHDQFYKDNVDSKINKEFIEGILKEILGHDAHVDFNINSELDIPIEVVSEKPKTKEINNGDLIKDPIVKKTLEMFNAKVVDIVKQ